MEAKHSELTSQKCCVDVSLCHNSVQESNSTLKLHTLLSDINECIQGNGGCGDVCTNFEGGFKCECSRNGFQIGPDGKTCQGRRTSHILLLKQFALIILKMYNFFQLKMFPFLLYLHDFNQCVFQWFISGYK